MQLYPLKLPPNKVLIIQIMNDIAFAVLKWNPKRTRLISQRKARDLKSSHRLFRKKNRERRIAECGSSCSSVNASRKQNAYKM